MSIGGFQSVAGGVMDIDPRKIGANINAGSLLATPENFGNNTNPGDMMGADIHPSVVDKPNYGDWFKVPDDSVDITATTFGLDAVWNVGAVGQPLLRAEWKGNPPFFHWSDTFHGTQMYVQLTPNTRHIFDAWGIAVPTAPIKVNENPPPTVLGVASKGITAILVLAVVGAGIYFLPPDFFRGWAKAAKG